MLDNHDNFREELRLFPEDKVKSLAELRQEYTVKERKVASSYASIEEALHQGLQTMLLDLCNLDMNIASEYAEIFEEFINNYFCDAAKKDSLLSDMAMYAESLEFDLQEITDFPEKENLLSHIAQLQQSLSIAIGIRDCMAYVRETVSKSEQALTRITRINETLKELYTKVSQATFEKKGILVHNYSRDILELERERNEMHTIVEEILSQVEEAREQIEVLVKQVEPMVAQVVLNMSFEPVLQSTHNAVEETLSATDSDHTHEEGSLADLLGDDDDLDSMENIYNIRNLTDTLIENFMITAGDERNGEQALQTLSQQLNDVMVYLEDMEQGTTPHALVKSTNQRQITNYTLFRNTLKKIDPQFVEKVEKVVKQVDAAFEAYLQKNNLKTYTRTTVTHNEDGSVNVQTKEITRKIQFGDLFVRMLKHSVTAMKLGLTPEIYEQYCAIKFGGHHDYPAFTHTKVEDFHTYWNALEEASEIFERDLTEQDVMDYLVARYKLGLNDVQYSYSMYGKGTTHKYTAMLWVWCDGDEDEFESFLGDNMPLFIIKLVNGHTDSRDFPYLPESPQKYRYIQNEGRFNDYMYYNSAEDGEVTWIERNPDTSNPEDFNNNRRWN